ncbi:putative sodium extrusion ABC transporter ATP-binding protein NatA [Clostridium sp. CAG:628]|jgi:ABC-2 type transport system ATP-binding protein|nr:putative sodium extrusion ABC transporter ATP-binding protein NatA [Clostridium sp. CAG:628]
MLKLSHVTKYYGDFLAVDDLSFEVKDGEIFGLLGVNGAGKTTTFRMITGLLDKTSGSITFNGKKIDYSVTDKLGFLTEERSLLTKLTVLEQAKFYGGLKGMSDKDIENRLDYLLEKLEITEYKNKKIKELSKGNSQKVQFIMSIINSPKLLILDEPFSGLDPINIELFKRLILELKSEGTSIIFSSHRMEHVEYFCESLVILVHGKTVLKGNLKQIKEDYQKKNIMIEADASMDELKGIKGVEKVDKIGNTFVVSISDKSYVQNVFNYVKKLKNVTKFVVEEPTLNEIFIDKVGGTYEK